MIAGYCWPQSVVPGEAVSVYCHCDTTAFEFEVVRVGATERSVFRSDRLPGVEQALPDNLAVAGCGWLPALEVEVDRDWPSGFYLLRLRNGKGEQAEAFFVVRPVQSHAALDAMLVLSTSTWSAYNDWGGPSFYTGGNTSSAERPLPKGFLEKIRPERYRIAHYADLSREEHRAYWPEGYSRWSMAAGWSNWEAGFVRWAENQGFKLGFATSPDLDRDPDLLTDYPAYVSVGHDEYWSAGMRDTVEGYIDAGGRAAFFSGNTAFWQARFESDYRQLVSYKTAITSDPEYPADGVGPAPLLSTMWSEPLIGRPENQMTGVSFSRGGYAHMPNAPYGTGGYSVERPDHWVFASLDLQAGAVLGDEPIVVAYECDGCEFESRDGRLVPTGNDGTPIDFEILATAPARLWETSEASPGLHERYIGELNWVAERIGGADTAENRARFEKGHAVMGTFKRGRGEVFTTGCTDWAYGIGDPQVSTVTRNVLERFTAR